MLLMAGQAGQFCQDTANIWRLLGYIVMIFKIVIPLLLIILGMVDLGKAVVASKDDAISKAVGTLIKRFIAAVVLFFIPTIVSAIFSAVGLINTDKNPDYLICIQCVTNMDAKIGNTKATCHTYADTAMGAISGETAVGETEK